MVTASRIVVCCVGLGIASCHNSGSPRTQRAVSAPAEAPSTERPPAAAPGGTSTLDRKLAAIRGRPSVYTLFESGPVRPLAIAPDRKRLFAANIPDGRLEVFAITPTGLARCGSVAVGLEPVAVAARSADEVWVVNHLSDSVSIVQLAPGCAAPGAPVGRVTRTLLVGDEPRDIVFAGPRHDRAFITTAHRGQNVPYDPQLDVPGVGRADVWVFDAAAPGESLTGEPIAIVNLFTDTPRALAATPDGSRVYAAGFHTGNRTTAIHQQAVDAGGGLPRPRTDAAGARQPATSLIVKRSGAHWVDSTGRHWDDAVKFNLPDSDVFVIDAAAAPPVLAAGKHSYAGVGTVLFNMVVNPRSGKVYVSNTDASNLTRFEGSGATGSTVRGRFAPARITVLDGRSVLPRHLNKHIDYTACCKPLPNATGARSVAQPLEMVVSGDGKTLYLAAFGSDKVAVYDTAALEADTFIPAGDAQIAVPGGGPSGLVLDEANRRLYVLTRFDNAISIIDTHRRTEVAHVRMHNPEPDSVIAGRPFLYSAARSSSNGEVACGSCHIFADVDSLAWDLGAPDETTVRNPGPFLLHPAQAGVEQDPDFHALKGPMTTQSLRGLANHGPMHWRGDRTGAADAPSRQPDSGAFDEVAAFQKFNPAFVSLNGRSAELSAAEMRAFTDFVLQLTYPPNPIRNLDDSLTAVQQAGRDLYFGPITDGFFNCNGCHILDPAGNAALGVARPGFFGSDGRYSFENEEQVFKVPHLRNAYQKVGMFGMPRIPLFPLPDLPSGQNPFQGDQVRGYGFLHDGSTDTMFRFHAASVFAQRPADDEDGGNPTGIPATAAGTAMRRQLEQFVLAFPSNLAPIVGQQITLDRTHLEIVAPRIALLEARAAAGECDLVARSGGRGLLFLGDGWFATDVSQAPFVSDDDLRRRAALPGGEVTYTCTPPGSGVRLGIDRDLDGVLDGDELRRGTDPADASSH